MEPIDPSIDIESRRMELRGVVHLAGEVIAQYWPMRTFVHHNPLHSLEYLPFEETVRRGKQFMGGNSYLPRHLYREYLKSGRIQTRHLDAALKPLVLEQPVHHRIAPGHAWRGVAGLSDRGTLRRRLQSRSMAELPDPAKELIDNVAAKLSARAPSETCASGSGSLWKATRRRLGRWLTLSHWCDDTLGTQIVRQINDQMIKWCEAFLDEGHATWPMPEREKGLYHAWKELAAQEWSPCGIADSRRKISRSCPTIPKMRCLRVWTRSAFPRISARITCRCN